MTAATARARAQARDRVARELLRRRQRQELDRGPAAIAAARAAGRAEGHELAELAAQLLEHLAPESTIPLERHALLVARTVLRARRAAP